MVVVVIEKKKKKQLKKRSRKCDILIKCGVK